MKYFVYILVSDRKPDWHYIGQTQDIKVRISYHNAGRVRSTKPYIPVRLVYSEEYTNRHDARVREFFLKKNAFARRKLYKTIV